MGREFPPEIRKAHAPTERDPRYAACRVRMVRGPQPLNDGARSVSLKSLLGGVMDGELGHPDLLRRVVDGIAKLKRHADRGVEVLPPEVEVHITVGEGSVQVIERFVHDPVLRPRGGGRAAQQARARARGPDAGAPLLRRGGQEDAGRGQGEPAQAYQLQDRGRRPRRQRRAHAGRQARVPRRARPLARRRSAGRERRDRVGEREGGQPPRGAPAPRRAAASSSRRSTRARPWSSPVRTASGCVPPWPPPAACPCSPATSSSSRTARRPC